MSECSFNLPAVPSGLCSSPKMTYRIYHGQFFRFLPSVFHLPIGAVFLSCLLRDVCGIKPMHCDVMDTNITLKKRVQSPAFISLRNFNNLRDAFA